jgi:hypothetical protein
MLPATALGQDVGGVQIHAFGGWASENRTRVAVGRGNGGGRLPTVDPDLQYDAPDDSEFERF